MQKQYIMPKNDMQWSSATPGYLILMIDQSGSMMSPYGNTGETRTSFATKAINRVINEIIQKNFNGNKPKNRCFITVIGYNHDVKEICSGYLEDLFQSPLRIETIKKKISDGAGGLIDSDYKMPIWVEPIDKDGATNMKGAFELARDLVKKWMEDKPNNPAPVIINISDGIPYYDCKDVQVCMRDTTQVAQEIMNMSCEDGNILIFNAEIGSEGGGKITYPNSIDEVKSFGDGAEFLYSITSAIPDGFEDAARKNELNISKGARGCIYHADDVELIKLNFGSSKGQKDKQ